MVKFTTLLSKIFALIAIALTAVTCKDFDIPQEQSDADLAANITIADLNQLVGDKTLTINEPLRICGIVTSSDQESNFYKTFTIEDTTAAVEVMAGIYGLHNIYPQGYFVTINLEGCGVGRHYGVLQVGLPAKAYDGYPTAYFSSRVLLDKHIFCHSESGIIAPLNVQPSQLDCSMCGKLVRIDGLKLTTYLHPDAWEANLEGTWHGYNFFSTENDETIVVHTSDYATYARKAIPQGTLSLTGILQHGTVDGKEYYMIKMRYESDCLQDEA